MSKKSTKETPVKKAEENAEEAVKRNKDLGALIVQEAMAIEDGSQHSVQQMLAYCRQLKKKKK